MFVRVRHVAVARIVVLRFPAIGVVAKSDVQLARGAFQNVDPICRRFGSQAPRLGFEPKTRRLIPTSRDSTVEQVLANPMRRLFAFDLAFSRHRLGNAGAAAILDRQRGYLLFARRGCKRAEVGGNVKSVEVPKLPCDAEPGSAHVERIGDDRVIPTEIAIVKLKASIYAEGMLLVSGFPS